MNPPQLDDNIQQQSPYLALGGINLNIFKQHYTFQPKPTLKVGNIVAVTALTGIPFTSKKQVIISNEVTINKQLLSSDTKNENNIFSQSLEPVSTSSKSSSRPGTAEDTGV